MHIHFLVLLPLVMPDLSRSEGCLPEDCGYQQPPWQRCDSGWGEVADSPWPLEVEVRAIRYHNESEFGGGSAGRPGGAAGGHGGNVWVWKELRSEVPPYKSCSVQIRSLAH